MNIRTHLYLLSAICSLSLLLQCSPSPSSTNPDLSATSNGLERKQRPFDHFFWQRAFPEPSIDWQSYERAIQQAQTSMGRRRQTLQGTQIPWRLEGPANIGGRINCLAIHPGNDQIIYAGLATGGVFKTTDGGLNWSAIFDQASSLSIGHIAIDPQQPERVYVGTGDPNISAYPFIGDGLYRTEDGGQTWTHLGLREQRIISRIAIDPTNNDVVYAACMGLPFERNAQRGLYKSTDGGQNWDQILYLSDSTGIIDLLMNPQDPQTLYAAGWDRIRNNFESVIYGPGAKIYKSTDGGQNWTQLANGLPQQNLSRIGLAMSSLDPNTIYALYNDSTFEVHGIYKSTNGGDSWQSITQKGQSNGVNGAMGGMGWYFGQIRVHPQNDDRLYVLGVRLWQTNNGGASWLRFGATPNGLQPHVDYHDLQFGPDASIYVSTDGGMNKLPSDDLNWQDIEDIPATQFFRVGYNPHRPDLYYGGAQDNGTIFGNGDGLTAWQSMLGGDGFQPLFHPTDSLIVYGESQFGNISRSTDGGRRFVNATAGIVAADPRNWDMPVIMSPHTADRLYTGTNRVYRAVGPSPNSPWVPISGDLTDPVKTNPFYHTISTLDESPLAEGLLYVGTSDGRLWRTENGGGSWESIMGNLPLRYLSSVVASPDSADHVFVCLSGYRFNEFTPLIYKSTDRGNSWEAIDGNLPDFALNDLVVPPGKGEQQLFVATDAGVYVTLNGGQEWERLGTDFPLIPVYDMTLNVAKNELVAGTFARSILSYPLDSLAVEPTASIRVAGQVLTADGEAIAGVRLRASQGGQESAVDNQADGSFVLDNVSADAGPLVLQPEIKTAPSNGISAYDLVLLSKHILDIENLENPYQIIAGDVNGSGDLTAFDMVDIRRIILGIDSGFQQLDSWRFLLASYNFPQPNDPFSQPFPEQYVNNQLTEDISDADFIGLKVGDVSGNANPQGIRSDEPAEERSAVSFQCTQLSAPSSNEQAIALSLEQFQQISALQMQLQFDPEQWSFEGWDEGQWPRLNGEVVSSHNAAKGNLSIIWINPKDEIIPTDQPMLYLRFRALGSEKQVALRIAEGPRRAMNSLAFGDQGVARAIVLQRKESVAVASSSLSLWPNPLSVAQPLWVDVLQAGEYRLQCRDVSGRIVMDRQVQWERGWHSLSDSRQWPSGLYVLSIQTADRRWTEKVLVVSGP